LKTVVAGKSYNGLDVLGMIINNPETALIDQHDLGRIMIRNGHPGKTKRTIQYLVRGSGKITVTYDSVKSGKVSQTITL